MITCTWTICIYLHHGHALSFHAFSTCFISTTWKSRHFYTMHGKDHMTHLNDLLGGVVSRSWSQHRKILMSPIFFKANIKWSKWQGVYKIVSIREKFKKAVLVRYPFCAMSCMPWQVVGLGKAFSSCLFVHIYPALYISKWIEILNGLV